MRNKTGMTLVEVLISVFILSTALCFVLATFVIGRMSVARAKHRIEVRSILRAKMEALKNTRYKDISSGGPYSVVIDPGADLIKDTDDDLVGEENIYVVDKNGYKEITVKLSWKELGWAGSKTVNEELVTYIYKWGTYL